MKKKSKKIAQSHTNTGLQKKKKKKNRNYVTATNQL